MKRIIKKILNESDFDWTNQVDPLQSFEDYFYGNDGDHDLRSRPGVWINRDINWWKDWIHEVEAAHIFFLDDIDEFKEMVQDLVNPRDGSEKYYGLSDDVYNFTKQKRELHGMSVFQNYASLINDAYRQLGRFAEQNNLTIIDTLKVFKQWLDKREKDNKPLH